MSDIVFKNFLDLNRLQIKDFYKFVSSSNMGKEIDNSILWELLNLRQMMSAKIRVSSKDLMDAKDAQDTDEKQDSIVRLDYVIMNKQDIIGYLCLRNTRKPLLLELIFYVLEEHLNTNTIEILTKELEKIKTKYYGSKIQIKINLPSSRSNLINLLKEESKFHLDKIDKKTYRESHYIFSVV